MTMAVEEVEMVAEEVIKIFQYLVKTVPQVSLLLFEIRNFMLLKVGTINLQDAKTVELLKRKE